jgi:hypothetical protein
MSADDSNEDADADEDGVLDLRRSRVVSSWANDMS